MTRDQAIGAVNVIQEDPDGFIDSLVVLGILKLEQPKTATDRALDILNRHLTTSGRTLTSHTLCDLMNLANVRIVDKS